MEFLTALGQDVAVSVKPAGERKDDGTFSCLERFFGILFPKQISGTETPVSSVDSDWPLKTKEKGHLSVTLCRLPVIAGAGFEPATFGL